MRQGQQNVFNSFASLMGCVSLSIVMVLALCDAARADISRGDVEYGKELTQTLERKTAAVRAGKDNAQKEEALKKLRAWLEAEKKKTRAELEKAEAADAKAEFERADARDTEILRLYYSFEPVFREWLSSRAIASSSKREKTCRMLPKEIRFNELAAKPDGTPLSAYGEQAIAVVNELCQKPL